MIVRDDGKDNGFLLSQAIRERKIGLYIRCIKYYKLLFHRDIQIPDKPE